MIVKDCSNYSRRRGGKSLAAALDAHGATRADKIEAGDILLFRYDR